jgi:hypothetical protein
MTTTGPTRIGKTTVAACAASSFAQVRHDDPVVAIDPIRHRRRTSRPFRWLPVSEGRWVQGSSHRTRARPADQLTSGRLGGTNMANLQEEKCR